VAAAPGGRIWHGQGVSRRLSINIFEYLDYRAFLGDAYRDLKAKQSGFSYRWFSRKAGLSSPNFLKLVIDGKRNLTSSTAEKFANALSLTRQESDFLMDLIGFNQATSAAEKNRYYARIGRYREHRLTRSLERDAFEYLSCWYYPAVRELVACEGFCEDPEWIAAALVPPISPAQANRSINLLLKLGLLERDETGGLKQGDPLISTGSEVRSLAVGNFHRQMMARAAAAIEDVDPEERSITSITISLSDTTFQQFKEKIAVLRSELMSLSAEEGAPTRVMQFNFQAFPLAKSKDSEDPLS